MNKYIHFSMNGDKPQEFISTNQNFAEAVAYARAVCEKQGWEYKSSKRLKMKRIDLLKNS